MTFNEITKDYNKTAECSSTPRGFSGFDIKMIAVISMFLDHFGATIVNRYMISLGYGTYELLTEAEWMRQYGYIYYISVGLNAIGRLAFPLFCFCLVEGFLHTGNRKKYLIRLCVFALLSEVPFDLALFGKWYYPNNQSIMLTLVIAFVYLVVREWVSKKAIPEYIRTISLILGSVALTYLATTCALAELKRNGQTEITLLLTVGIAALFYVLILLIQIKLVSVLEKETTFWFYTMLASVFALAAHFLKTDYGGLGVIVVAIFYEFREQKELGMLFGVIASCVYYLLEVCAVLDVIVIRKYNYTAGKKVKYFFYFFYPVHLLLLYYIAVILHLI